MAVIPRIWGHRGAFAYAPENTLPGFHLAAQMGADGVELDIQLSKDGAVVVIHDETVDRTSDHEGRVHEYTLKELKTMNFNKRGITKPFLMEIPTLDEVFALLAPTGMSINVELKTNVVRYEGIEQKALALAGRHGLLDRVVWSSFNHYSVQAIKQEEPQARTALLCSGGILVTGEQCEKTGAEALHCHVQQLRWYPGLVGECHSRGVLVRPWVVDEEADFRLAVELEVDTVMTNDIARAKQLVCP